MEEIKAAIALGDIPALLRLIDGLKHVAHGDVQLASEVLDATLGLEGLAMVARARGLTVRSYMHSLNNEYDLALTAIDDALAWANKCEDARERNQETAWAQLARVQPLVVRGDFAGAVKSATAARDLFLKLGLTEPAARASVNLGNALSASGDAMGSLKHFEDGLLGLTDSAARGMTHNNRGMSLVELDRFDEALAAYAVAKATFVEGGQDHLGAMAEGNIADLLSRMGRVDEAIAKFASARALYERAGEAADATRLISEEGDAWLSVGAYARARTLYEEGIPELERAGMRLEAARARLGLGLAFLTSGNLKGAVAHLLSAQREAQETSQPIIAAEANLAMSAAHEAMGDRERAKELAELACSGFSESPLRQAVALTSLAQLLGQGESAWDAIFRAHALIKDFEVGPAHWRVAHCHAKLLRERGELEDALSKAQEAMARAEMYRGSMRDETLKTYQLAQTGDLYVAVCELALACDAPGKEEIVFDAVERMRHRTLHDALSGGGMGGSGEKGWKAQETSIARVQSRLGDGVACVSFFSDGEDLSVQILKRNEQRIVRKVVPRSALASLSRRTHLEMLRAQGMGERGKDHEGAHAKTNEKVLWGLVHKAARETFAPLQSELEGASRIVLARHGELHGLAMQAGVLGLESMFGCEVLDVPGIGLAMNEGAQRERAGKEIGTGEVVLVGVGDQAAPKIEEEVRRIEKVLRGTRAVSTLTGSAAGASAVLEALSRAGTVHLACHCEFDAEFPMLSTLHLHDGKITAREVAEHLRPGCVVVLAGCESGRSAAVGEERLGMVRALLASGAGAIISSVWPLHDETASDMFEDVYAQLNNAADWNVWSWTRAVRSAQARMMHSGRPVSQWGGVCVVGGVGCI